MHEIPMEYVARFPVEKMVEHPENPNKGSVDGIRESIEENDFYGAVLIQKHTSYIIAGNHRKKAAELSGASHLPAMIVDCDDELAYTILTADNRFAERGSYEPGQLIAQLQSVGTKGTGYTKADLERLMLPPSIRERSSATGEVQTEFRIGDFRFRVPSGQFHSWESDMRRSYGFDKQSISKGLLWRLLNGHQSNSSQQPNSSPAPTIPDQQTNSGSLSSN